VQWSPETSSVRRKGGGFLLPPSMWSAPISSLSVAIGQHPLAAYGGNRSAPVCSLW
jgi:hypothetical protein